MKVYTIGGYNKVGKNMTAIESEGEIVILDMGLDMEQITQMEQEVERISTKEAIKLGAIPDDQQIHDQRDKVKGIVVGHGHLDHVGAVPKLGAAYDAPIITTPYTMKIVDRRATEDRKTLKNERVALEPGSRYWVSNRIEIEFVHVTHSIPGTVMTLIHTPEGTIAYGLDFRLDKNPTLGKPTDYLRIKQLGGERVKLFIGDSTRVELPGSGSTEQAVKTQLKFALDEMYEEGGGAFATTFSSHIERLNSLLAVNDGRRKVAMLGRSLKEYVNAAAELGLIDLSGVVVASYNEDVAEVLQDVQHARDQWLVICTGNQGEPGSMLVKMAEGKLPFNFQPRDHVLFSSDVIPTPATRASRDHLEQRIKAVGAEVQTGIHVSGHARREDIRQLIRWIRPANILPAHGTLTMTASFASLAQEEGYQLNENLFLCQDGNVMEF